MLTQLKRANDRFGRDIDYDQFSRSIHVVNAGVDGHESIVALDGHARGLSRQIDDPIGGRLADVADVHEA